MPFDLSKTTHIFRMTDSGGVQSVVVKNAQDKDQIGSIRQHLQHEAEAFQRGDYTDPISLHGTAMPGVSELASHHAEITVSYSLNWLFWQMGSTPYLGGGFGHFYAYAPVKIKYAIDRFSMEV